MKLKLPIGEDVLSTFARWAAELRRGDWLVPDEFNYEKWEPVISGSGSLVIASPVIHQALCDIKGGRFEFDIAVSFTISAGTGASIRLSAPVVLEDMNVQTGHIAVGQNAGTEEFMRWRTSVGQLNFFRQGVGNWSGNCFISAQGFAPVAGF